MASSGPDAAAQAAAFATLAAADPEAFKHVVNLAVDFGILRDALDGEPLTTAGKAALEAANRHATAAAQAIAALTENTPR